MAVLAHPNGTKNDSTPREERLDETGRDGHPEGALVAVPSEYLVTGMKTYIVNNDGIVCQKDLGPNSINIVKDMELYNSDPSWHRTDDEWPQDVAAADH
jgi:hypothetical protein